jgi:hypothetical protein
MAFAWLGLQQVIERARGTQGSSEDSSITAA